MAHQAAVDPATWPAVAPGERTWAVQPSRGGWRTLRRGLVVGWLLLSALALVLGEHHSSLAELESDVANGDVHVVRVAGSLPPGGTGFSTVELHWRRGLRAYETEVIEARPRSQAPGPADRAGVTAVIGDSVTARLRTIQPGLRVEHVGRTGSSVLLLGGTVPGWAGLAALVLGLLTLGLLVAGPPPWRATRWAWFWLMVVVPPVGFLAFLLLSGPTPLLSEPRPESRRLKGGWAFVLYVAISSALQASL